MTHQQQIEHYRLQVLRMREILDCTLAREQRLQIEVEALRVKMDHLAQRMATIHIAHN